MKKFIAIILTILFVNIFITPANAVIVPAGKKIPIVPDGTTTSKGINNGDLIFGHVRNNITVGNKVVIAEGATATINVVSVHKARRWGAAGDITLINGTVEDINGIERPVQFDYEIKGTEKDWVKVTAGLCIATVILIPFGLLALIKGGEANIQPNNIINAELISDFTI